MDEDKIAVLLIAAAVPVVLPIVLKQVRSGGESVDEAVESNALVKKLVDDVLVPAAQTFLDEIKEDRGADPAIATA